MLSGLARARPHPHRRSNSPPAVSDALGGGTCIGSAMAGLSQELSPAIQPASIPSPFWSTSRSMPPRVRGFATVLAADDRDMEWSRIGRPAQDRLLGGNAGSLPGQRLNPGLRRARRPALPTLGRQHCRARRQRPIPTLMTWTPARESRTTRTKLQGCNRRVAFRSADSAMRPVVGALMICQWAATRWD